MTENLQPQSLGAIIDQYRTLYDQRAELNRQADALTKDMATLAPQILTRLGELEIDSAKGKLAQVRVEEKVYPAVKDWDAFYQHIKNSEAFYLLEKRPTVVAFRELIAAGETIPGVEPFTRRDLICTAI